MLHSGTQEQEMQHNLPGFIVVAEDMQLEQAQAAEHDARMQNEAGKVTTGVAVAVASALAVGVLVGGPLFNRDNSGADNTEDVDTNGDTIVDQGQGINPETGLEYASHIAEQGSCSIYTSSDVEAAANADPSDLPTRDLNDVEVAFLHSHPDFAAEYGSTAEQRIGTMWDALGVRRPSQSNEHNRDNAMSAVFANRAFRSGQLVQDTVVQNTFCEADGTVRDYRVVTLEAGTFVGGVVIEDIHVDRQGNRVATFSNGRSAVLQGNELIASVILSNGDTVRMMAGFKQGIDTDNDGEPELGCDNVLEQPPVGTPHHPRPRRPGTTTSTTPGTTPTTGYDNKHPVPIVGQHPTTPIGHPTGPVVNPHTYHPTTSIAPPTPTQPHEQPTTTTRPTTDPSTTTSSIPSTSQPPTTNVVG